MREKFLPTTRRDLEERGIDQLDFVYVSGDAYVDHPAFGAALISRVLTSFGYTVGMICQPDFRDAESIARLGRPRLGFLVSAGNMDSMVNHYTVARKHRQTDSYSPGGKMGLRPDRAVIVYGNLIRQRFPDIPVIIGGIEASLRRLSHYDYWGDKVRRSVLLDSGADLISYGMGEKSIVEIADCLNAGMAVKDITFVRGTVYKTRRIEDIYDGIRLPDHDQVKASKEAFAESFRLQYRNTDPFQAKTIYEVYDGALAVVQNPPAMPLTTMEMDDLYELPYAGTWHPDYDRDGGIPALSEVKFSITSNRGCFGSCSFCALTFHQGRIIQRRSRESIVREAVRMTEDPDFKGYIHDVGGPTADFYQPACQKQLKCGTCSHRLCMFPEPCPNLEADHTDYLEVLRELRQLPGVKKVFVRSGVRFDYVMADPRKDFLEELCRYHISGQLRTAPEHVSDRVLKRMGKPRIQVYQQFTEAFETMNRKLGMDQYIVPYLMSSHPGSRLEDAVEMAEYLRNLRHRPKQVQDFYPTPGTVSTCMYYTGLDPLSGESVYVPRDSHEKAIQRALVQYWMPGNRALVREGLTKAGRTDLIGYGKECLVPPEKPAPSGKAAGPKRRKGPGRNRRKG